MNNRVYSQKTVENPSWVDLVRQAIHEEQGKLWGSTCRVYKKGQTIEDSEAAEQCLCGRLPRRHSFTTGPRSGPIAPDGTWSKFKHATKSNVTVYGIWNNKTKFIRWDSNRNNEKLKKDEASLPTMAKILKADITNNEPFLLVSCFGGAKYFKMNHKLEKDFKDAIGEIAATKGVWLLSTGLNSGVSKVIGQSVERHALLNRKKANYTLIGLTSWGCLSDRTRQVFRKQAQKDSSDPNTQRRQTIVELNMPSRFNQKATEPYSTLDENEPDTLEHNHTHFLMDDDGSEGERRVEHNAEKRFYLTDESRSKFVNEIINPLETDDASMRPNQPYIDVSGLQKVKLTECHSVTIIIEGGLESFEVIANDLENNRPVVIIHGSGRCATVIGNLLELTKDQIKIEDAEIDRQLKKHIIPKSTEKTNVDNYREKINTILNHENLSHFLTVFKLDNDTSLTDTIFLAIHKAHMKNKPNDSINKLLELAVMWNCGSGIDEVFENNEVLNLDEKLNIELFEKALINNRPAFVDYFLRKQYNILQTIYFLEFKKTSNEKTFRETNAALNTTPSNEKTIRETNAALNTTPSNNQTTIIDDQQKREREEDDANLRAIFAKKFLIKKLHKERMERSKESYKVYSFVDLDELYYRLIGPYSQSFYNVQSTKYRIKLDFRFTVDSLFEYFNCFKKKRRKSSSDDSNEQKPRQRTIIDFMSSFRMDRIPPELGTYICFKKFRNEEMLRDLFIWSILSENSEMSFVLLLQSRSRIIASLIAAGITGRLISKKDGYLDHFHKLHKQSQDYEKFATECIDVCYKRNEKTACQLLLREIPLFGNVNCMQVAISFRLKTFINSRCFDQVLNRQWYGALDQTTNQQMLSKILFILSIISLGFLAPWLLYYRDDGIDDVEQEKSDISNEKKQLNWGITLEGVEDQNIDEMGYWGRFKGFHRSPIVQMTYHFLIYIWMLLAFSYFMLFEIKSSDQPTHWTEIYVIITISAMLLEDLRKIVMEYFTQMLERWHREDLWIINLYALPYMLFYIGIGLHFISRNRPDLFASAKIVLALDLEIWFLFSLRFVSAIKLLGPKLFMIRNMLRDLIGFLYVIFVCIAAYGIVSRSLVIFDSLQFTLKDVSYSVFYRPYWFLYSVVDDERNDLNAITQNDTYTEDQIAEATTVQVLFIVHMLFINILILNLLIAVFNFTINDVQEKSAYLWRYQRYELIREYFEKPYLCYPPLSLIGYLIIFIKFIIGRRENLFRIFKRFSENKNKYWTDFEKAATDNYTRTFVDRMYRDSSTLVIPTFSEIDELKIEVEALKRENNRIHTTINHIYTTVDRMDGQAKKTIPATNWMMTAMKRVKMASSSEPPPILPVTTTSNK